MVEEGDADTILGDWCFLFQQISSPPDSVESGIPPDESHPDEYSS